MDRAWHLDKRVPLAIIFTLIMQVGTFIWWARGIAATQDMIVERATDISRRVERLETLDRVAALAVSGVNERLARIDERTGSLVRMLGELREQAPRPRQ